MAYLNCPSCGLSFRVQAMDLIVENCPRCLARAGRVSRLQLSNEPHAGSVRQPNEPPPAVHVPPEIPLGSVPLGSETLGGEAEMEIGSVAAGEALGEEAASGRSSAATATSDR